MDLKILLFEKKIYFYKTYLQKNSKYNTKHTIYKEATNEDKKKETRNIKRCVACLMHFLIL